MKNKIRLLNTQVARTWFTTIPKWRGGANLGSLAAGEIGLDTNADVKRRREDIIRLLLSFSSSDDLSS